MISTAPEIDPRPAIATTSPTIPPASHARTTSDLHETCQTLLHRLGWPGLKGRPAIQTLGFTSCHSGEGVSTVAAHVAFTAALAGPRRVVLVDLNFARPAVQQALEVELAPGVRDVLAGKLSLADAVQCTSLTQFMALTAGSPFGITTRPDPAALSALVSELRQSFDLVVFDLPGCDQASTTLTVAGLLDGICLVVEAERVRAEVALRTKDILQRSGANLVGAVMNKQPRHVPNWLYRTL